jgi:hypothetical protein
VVELAHQQAVENGRLVGQAQVARARRDPARQQAVGRAAEALVAQAVQGLVDRCDEIGRMHHADPGAFGFRPLGLERTVEVECHLAVGARDRQRLALEDGEIGGIAQVVVLPGVAVEQENVEAGFRHGLAQAPPALGEHRRHAGAFTGFFVAAGTMPYRVAAASGETSPSARSCAKASRSRSAGSP